MSRRMLCWGDLAAAPRISISSDGEFINPPVQDTNPNLLSDPFHWSMNACPFLTHLRRPWSRCISQVMYQLFAGLFHAWINVYFMPFYSWMINCHFSESGDSMLMFCVYQFFEFFLFFVFIFPVFRRSLCSPSVHVILLWRSLVSCLCVSSLVSP